MPDRCAKSVYSIPAHFPFMEALARGVLTRYAEDHAALRHLKILLPTRRACRNMRDAFLRITDGQPFILPQLLPIGDLDEDELKLSAITHGRGDAIASVKSAISPLRRRLLLAQLIEKMPDHQGRPEQAVALADSLARLIDNVHNEGLNFDELTHLVKDEFAGHWQITLDFLEIIRQHWPAILEAENCIDPADRRNRLIYLLIDLWQDAPPSHPIIAAGITGSMPSTSSLLDCVASLENGEVILPGLDPYIDQESWAEIDDNHPQHGFKKLLSHMGLGYDDVQDWPDCGASALPALHIQRRLELCSQLMRPAATTYQWAHLDESKKADLQTALEGVNLITSKTAQDEAEKISILLRQTLEDPSKTAIVVTPDRQLARRIGAAMRRWGILLDDSAGTPMHYTRIGGWLQISAAFLIEDLRPFHFLNFLHHQLCACGLPDSEIAHLASIFDKEILRGAAPASGFAGVYARIDALENVEKGRALPKEIADRCRAYLAQLAELCAPFTALLAEGKQDFNHWLDAHIMIAEALATQPEKEGAQRLWHGEDGEEIARFLSELKRQVYNLPKLDGASYLAILIQLMRSVAVRPLYGTHPRLQVLGQLEARMIHADTVIIAGLNETIWPADPGHDPWMSRPMRAEFGLPALEQSIGQAAHDFSQCFAAPNLYLSRAERQGDAPAVTSRWLLRMNALMQAFGRELDSLEHQPVHHWHNLLSANDDRPAPCARPAPRPPVSARPKALAVTSIGKWMRDPYSIYARYVLRLKPLKPIEDDATVLDQGLFLHAVLERFQKAHRDVMPGNALEVINGIASETKENWPEAQNIPSFWWPRFQRAMEWFVTHETAWRKQGHRSFIIESRGEITWQGFALSATADRIDHSPSDGAIIIDYKTGAPPAKKDMEAGFEPQLPLEALILNHGGFGDKKAASGLEFWQISGGHKAGNVNRYKGDIAALLDEAEQGFSNLLEAFAAPDTPFFSLPDPAAAPPDHYQDYAHLARVKEWENAQSEEALNVV